MEFEAACVVVVVVMVIATGLLVSAAFVRRLATEISENKSSAIARSYKEMLLIAYFIK